MKTACVIGGWSDIGQALAKRLILDGWDVLGWGRGDLVHLCRWDMLIFCIGTMKPIGRFTDVNRDEWENSIEFNALLPLRMFRDYYPMRNPGARVFFFDGPNLSSPTPTYSAYRAGKAILAAVVPTLNVECPDVRFTLLHTGVVKTKIHQQTIDAGPKAANYDRAVAIMEGREQTTSFDDIYRMIA